MQPTPGLLPGPGEEDLIAEFIVYDDPDPGGAVPLVTPTPEPAVQPGSSPSQPPPLVGTPVESPLQPGVTAVATQSVAPPQPTPTPPVPSVQSPEPASNLRTPDGMVLVSRTGLYLQWILLVLVAGTSFGAGLFIGRGQGPAPEAKQNFKEVPKKLVLVQGRLVYLDRPGQVTGDDGAVVIAVPQGAYPPARIKYEGLRPSDPAGNIHEQAVDIVQAPAAGGSYIRADKDGEFLLTVSRPGNYYLLYISKQAMRSHETPIEVNDLAMMDRYFDSPELLIGRQKYVWQKVLLDGDFKDLDPYDFGASATP